MGFLAGLFGGHAKAMPIVAAGLPIQSSTQGLPIPLVFGTNKIAPNLIWYGDFVATAQQSTAGAGGKGGVGGGGGGKGGGGSTQYTYKAAFQFGLCDGPILGIRNVYVNKQITTLAALGYTSFLGGYLQSPWGYLTTNHPTQALNYHGLAHIDNPAYQMGNSPQIPNHNVEVQARYSNATTTPGDDADPSQIVNFLLTDAKSGAGYPSAQLGDLSAYQAYCIANGLWLSPVYISQTACSSMIKELLDATNSAAVFSSGILSIIPYGDQALTANGYVYIPPVTAEYDVGDDDFAPQPGDDPVYLDRDDNADAFNSIQIECVDRNNQYNPAVVSAKDQALIDIYGLRETTETAHYFADLNAGRLSAQLKLQKQSKRNKYRFTLDHRYVLLDPMDLITLTCYAEDGTLWLDHVFVRILSIDEDQSGNFAMVAEEYPAGVASAPAYTFETGSGFAVDYNATPGNANTPVVFEPPIQISQSGGLEVNIAASGGAFWGGCEVWVSPDDSSYKYAGRITGKARHGVLMSSLAMGADPDTVNTLYVDLSQSSGDLNSGTQADADANHTLCYVDGEYISYETASLIAANEYGLSYLRRGQFGTTIATHALGTKFARMDGGIFAYPYDKSKVGQILYIKLLSFNLYGGGLQSLSDVSPTVYTLAGPPLKSEVAGFQVLQNGNSVVFKWSDSLNDSGLKGYDIAYGAIGSAWADKQMLTEAHRGTEMTNADVPPGPWEFSIRAHDIADLLGPESLIQFTVSNPNALVLNNPQEPGWTGTCSDLVPHPNGWLVPNSLYPMSHYSDYTDFDNMVNDPVSSGYYITPAIDIGQDSNLRVYDTVASTLGVGNSGGAASLQFAIDTWLDGASDPNSFTNWGAAYVNFRYLRGKITYSGITATNVSKITDFTVLADVAPTVPQSGELTVAPGGTTLTFPNAYHSPPYVVATPTGGSALYATVTSITATSCVIHVWNSSGTDVGGTVNWNSQGT